MGGITTMRNILAAFFVWLSASAMTQASTLDFFFSFNNTGYGGGSVTGIIRGLQDNATSAATSVEVLTHTGGFGTGEYIGAPQYNTFTLSAGILTEFEFLSRGALNTSPAVTCCALFLGGNTQTGIFSAGLSDFSFTIIPTDDTGLAITPVPLPASLPLLLIGVAGAAALKRRKKVAA